MKTIFFGKFIGKDDLGNKYYKAKIVKGGLFILIQIDASKIPVEWYSWIHHTPNKIQNKHNF